MCERFTQHYAWREIHGLYGLPARKPSSRMRPRYKICPTTTIDTVRLVNGTPTCAPMRWGLVPNWWGMGAEPENPATFNTHIETVATLSFFRSSFRRRHCLIPVSGFYALQDKPGGRQPYYCARRDGAVMTIAGLWDEWRHPDTGRWMRSCSMMIGEPNKFVTEVCGSMPVILERGQFEPWLRGEAEPALLLPAAEKVLKKHPVSKRVIGVRASDTDRTLIRRITLRARVSSRARPETGINHPG